MNCAYFGLRVWQLFRRTISSWSHFLCERCALSTHTSGYLQQRMCSHVFTFSTMWRFVINLRLLVPASLVPMSKYLPVKEQSISLVYHSAVVCLLTASFLREGLPTFAVVRSIGVQRRPCLDQVMPSKQRTRRRDGEYKWPSPKHVEFPRGRVDAPAREASRQAEGFHENCCM